MIRSKQAQLQAALEELRRGPSGIKGALITTAEGLPVAHTFRSNDDAERVAAMAATALGLGSRLNTTLATGALQEMSISGSLGQVYLYSTGRGALAVVAPGSMNLGVVHLQARQAAGRIAAIL